MNKKKLISIGAVFGVAAFLLLLFWFIGVEHKVTTVINEEENAEKKAKESINQLMKAYRGEYSSKPISEYQSENQKMFLEAIGTLRNIGKPAIPYMMEIVKEEGNDLILRDMMVELVGNTLLDSSENAKTIEELVKIANDKKQPEPIRSKALNSIGMSGDKIALLPLLTILNDREEKYQIRASAVSALGGIRDKTIVTPLIEILKDKNESDKIKIMAMSTLAYLGDENIVNKRVNLLKQKGKYKFAEEIKEISNIVHDQAEKSIIGLLKNSEQSVRIEAISTLSRIGDKKAVEPLINILIDTNENIYIRTNVAESLAKLKDEDPEKIIDILINIMETEDNYLSIRVAELLGNIGDKKATEPIKRKLNGKTSYGREQLERAYKKLTEGKEK